MALRLLEGAHDSKGAEEVALGVSGQARDDGVVGPLPGPQAVGVLRVQDEPVAPILQSEAAALRHNACSTSHNFTRLHAVTRSCKHAELEDREHTY